MTIHPCRRGARAPGLSRAVLAALALALLAPALLAGCGGGSSSSLAANQMRVVVEPDPDLGGVHSPANAPNMLYASVVVCDDSDHCVTVPYVQVDTGSTGLRLRYKALRGLDLQPVVSASGAQMDACSNFAQGYIWGSIEQATVQLGGEPAVQMPVQVYGSGGPAPAVPAPCASFGNNIGSLAASWSNGILGVDAIRSAGAAYFACQASSCTFVSSVNASFQIVNPVALLGDGDDNGVILSLPAIPAGGAPMARGTLTFGLDTHADNLTAGFQAMSADAYAAIDMSAQGLDYPQTVLDSGSNYDYLPFNLPYDSATLAYTPSTLQNVPITLRNAPGTLPDVSVSSSVALINAFDVAGSSNDAFDDIGSYVPSSSSAILGLPYLFGRSVAYGISGTSSALGTGPLIAVLGP